ncbi:MAG: DNA replication and repair protein RecF [Polyangiales bacterium]|nr:DNA replication and repair protein RecF [Myxococcales bacterium]
MQAPLRIERLSARRFRNLRVEGFEPGAHFNVIHGENGAGKSNLLEAIHIVAGHASFRGARAEDLIALGEGDTEVLARVTSSTVPNDVRVFLSRAAARRTEVNGKRPRSTAALRSLVPIVLFHPGHLTLSAGGADGRRGYLDHALEQTDPAYAGARASYEKALRSRNRLLKAERVDRRAVEAFDAILAETGAVIGSARASFIEVLSPRAEAVFAEVSGDVFPFHLAYAPRVEPKEAAIRAALERSFEKDLARGFTAEGPHADDMSLVVRADTNARHHVSQGQHRAIALALKVAELELLQRYTGRVPILLLDDVSSELDRARNRRFFELLSRMGGQVFLTTTHPEYIQLAESRTDVFVEAGRLSVSGGSTAGVALGAGSV